MYDFVPEKSIYSLCEISQKVDMKFAFAHIIEKGGKATLKQIHQFIKCRDFLGDALFATHHGKQFGIYGFRFDGSKIKVDTEKTILLIRYNGLEKLQNGLNLLNYLERKAHWKKSRIIDLGAKDGSCPIYLALGSKKWVSSPQLISLYTLLLRLGAVMPAQIDVDRFLFEPKFEFTTRDTGYLDSINKCTSGYCGLTAHPILLIMRNSKKLFEGCYKEYGSNTYNIHELNGILTLVQRAGLTKRTQDGGESYSETYSSISDKFASDAAKRLKQIFKGQKG